MFRFPLRSIGLSVALAFGLAAGCPLPVLTPAAAAEDSARAVGEALLLPGLFEVMRKEGEAYGKDLDAQFLGGAGGTSWQEAVARIYDPVRLDKDFYRAFAAELTTSGGDPAPMLAFFNSDLGKRIMVLELSAREALLDDAIEEGARATYDQMAADGDPRIDLLRGYVDANHLIDLNVASALNANVAFLRALGEAADASERMPEDEILAQVWAQEEEVRAETESWMMSYAAMAYAPLTDEELQSYIDFSGTPEGIALNRALFAGFDALFASVSRDLGRSLGHSMVGTSL